MRLLLRFFVRWHIASRVSELRRTSFAQAAVDRADPSYSAVAVQLDEFAKSIPAVRLHRALSVSLVSVFVVAFLLARAAPEWDPTLSFLFKRTPDGESTSTAKVGLHDASHPLANMTGALLSLSPEKAGNALKSFACQSVQQPSGKSKRAKAICSAHRGLVTSVTSLILLSLAVWIVALVPLTSFRLKRMVFNLDADDGVRDLLRSQVAGDHFSTAQGIYRIEADLYREFRRRRPQEIPFDLICQACLLMLPIYSAVLAATFFAYGLRWDVRYGRYPGDVTALAVLALLSAALASFAAARLGTLRWAHRRRVAGAGYPVDQVLHRATLRRRLVAHCTDSAPFVVLGTLVVLDAPLLRKSEIGGVIAVFVLAPLALAAAQAPFIANSGRTFGKALLGLRVVRSDGSAVSKRRTFIREVLLKGIIYGLPWLLLAILLWHLPFSSRFWWIAVATWPLYGIAYVCATWNLRHSPVHDLVLDTVVVDERLEYGTAAAAVTSEPPTLPAVQPV